MARISIPVASACISVLFLLGTLPAQTTDETAPPSRSFEGAHRAPQRGERHSSVGSQHRPRV